MIHRFRLVLPDGLNEELSAEVLHRAATEPSHPSFNRGGWRSGEDMLAWPIPAVSALLGLVREAFASVSPATRRARTWRAWCLVNRGGSRHARHRHTGEWSGIYYATTSSGDTVFEAPAGIERVTPEAGLLVISPSHVFHSVDPCFDEAPRITVAFEAY